MHAELVSSKKKPETLCLAFKRLVNLNGRWHWIVLEYLELAPIVWTQILGVASPQTETAVWQWGLDANSGF